MGASLSNLMRPSGMAHFKTADYHNYIEDNLTFLRSHAATERHELDPAVVERYLYDFTGLLTKELQIPLEDQWVVLRMNGFTHYDQLDSEVTSLLIPDREVLKRLKQLYRTVSGKL